MIGIIGAMEEEVAHLVKLCEEREEIVQGPYRFYKGDSPERMSCWFVQGLESAMQQPVPKP